MVYVVYVVCTRRSCPVGIVHLARYVSGIPAVSCFVYESTLVQVVLCELTHIAAALSILTGPSGPTGIAEGGCDGPPLYVDAARS